MRDALLFDLDGTLLDSDPIHKAVFRELLARHGVVLGEDAFQAHVLGRTNRDIFARLLPDAPDPDALGEAKEEEFRRRLPRPFPAAPGLDALLDRARRAGWRCAVVTNAPRANADAMLAAIGLADRFETIVTAADCARGKPDPAPYQEAMRRLGVTPDCAIAFEDSPSGTRAAQRSGAYTIGVRSSLSDNDLRQAGARMTIQDFTDPALEQILGAPEGALS